MHHQAPLRQRALNKLYKIKQHRMMQIFIRCKSRCSQSHSLDVSTRWMQCLHEFGWMTPILPLFTTAINKTGKMAQNGQNKIEFLMKSPQETVGEIPIQIPSWEPSLSSPPLPLHDVWERCEMKGERSWGHCRGQVHTTDEEFGRPWIVAAVGVPLMALKMCSESGRGLRIPSSAGLICGDRGEKREEEQEWSGIIITRNT